MQGTWPYEPVLLREEAQHSWERMDKTIIRPLGQRLAQHKLCVKRGVLELNTGKTNQEAHFKQNSLHYMDRSTLK